VEYGSIQLLINHQISPSSSTKADGETWSARGFCSQTEANLVWHLHAGGCTIVVADRGAIEKMLQLEQKSIPSRFSAADAAVSWILKKKNLPDILYFTLVPELYP